MGKININRRNFIRKGTAGAAGALVLGGRTVKEDMKPDVDKIIYRTLGKTGLKVPVVSFGVMRSDSPGLCKAAYENGIIFFDTANVYQNGNNESMLGNLFKNWPRNTFIAETKVKPEGIGRDGLPSSKTTTDDFLGKFSLSLSRLQLDYVDILLIHDLSNPEILNYKPLLNAVSKLKKDKKTRFIGFSTHSNMASMLNAASESPIWDVVLTSYNFRLPDTDQMNQAINKAAGAGLGIIAMKTMAGGSFMDKEKTRTINSSAALKWVLSNPNVHTTIPGMTTFDHLALNLSVLSDIEMTEKEKEDLIAMAGEQGMFCVNCNSCIGSCRLNLPVPDLMRAFMYAYGYSSPVMAYELLGELGTGMAPCINCDECTVHCSRGFGVREKIADVSRIVGVSPEFLT